MKKSLMLILIILTLGLFASLWGQTTIWSQDFDGAWTLPTTLSPAWSGTTTPADNVWHRNDYTTGWAGTSGAYSPTFYNGTYSARFHSYDAASASTGDFITPAIDCSGSSNTKLLEFYYINTSGTDKVEIYLSTDNGSNYGSVLYTTGVASTWTKYTVVLGTTNATQAMVKFKATSDYGTTDIGIDAVKIIDYGSVGGPLSGSRTINSGGGGNYLTFTAAINDLNMWGVGTGGVIFNVASGTTYTENCPPITATGTSGNLITFQKDGATANPIIYAGVGTGSSDAILTLTGTDYLIWDGIDLLESAGNTTTTTQAEYGLFVKAATATNGAQYNIFKNFKIVLNNTNTSTKAIYHYYGVSATSSAGANSNNDYYYVTIENCATGIYMYGTSTTYPDENNSIRYCTVGSASANNIYNTASSAYGMYIYNQKNSTIRNNEVQNVKSNYIYGYAGGIYISSQAGTNTGASNRIFNNKIHDIGVGYSTTSYYTYGLYVSLGSTASQDIRIYNNMIWNLTHASTTTSATVVIYGVYLTGGAATTTVNFDFNSVRVAGTAAQSNYCFYTAVTSINKVRNNIFANFSPSQTTSTHGCWYSATAGSVGAAGSLSNNNDLYLDNTTNGYIGRGGTTTYATLTNWRAITAAPDANGKDGNPKYLTTTNLHIDGSDSPMVYTPVESAGYYNGGAITWVTADIDGDTRHASTPDMGADEGDFNIEVPCAPPANQPTVLVFGAPASTVLNGSFTISDAERYLVVRGTAAHSVLPVNGTTYSANAWLGNGKVVQSSSTPSFSATALNPDSTYIFTIYGYNFSGTGTTPQYKTSGPLTGSQATLPNPPSNPSAFSATASSLTQINLAATTTERIMVAWNTTSTFGTPASDATYSSGSSITGGGTVLYLGDVSGLPNHTDLFGGTTYYYKAWCYLSSGIYKVYSTGYATQSATTLRPDNPATFTATTFSPTQINLDATANLAGHDILVFWGSTSTFGTPNPDSTYTVGNNVTGGGKVYYKGPAASLPDHSSLTAATSYYYKAWSYVATGIKNTYSTGTAISAATYIAAPFTENFDGVTTPNLPSGWSKLLGTYGTITTSTSYPYSTPNSLYMYVSSSEYTVYPTLITPPIQEAINTLKLSFRMYSTYANAAIAVGTMPTPTGTFTQIGSTIASTSLTETVEYSIYLNSYAGTDKYLAIRSAVPLGGYSYIYLDNVSVDVIPTAATFAVTPTTYNFGTVDVTSPWTKNFTITNNGFTPLGITNISISGSSNYTLVSVPSPLPTLNLGQTSTFGVKYQPVSAGADSAYVSITDDVARTVHQILVKGTAVALSSLPYSQNFDGTSNVVISPDASWVIGTPAKTQMAAAHSAPNSIVTRSLTASVQHNENSTVTLPTLDLSTNPAGVIVSFWQNSINESNWDGGYFEYSTNYGSTWKKVDPQLGTGGNYTTSTSYNWYNNSSTSGPATPPKWSDSSTLYTGAVGGWIQSATLISRDTLGTATNLKLRYHFFTDGSRSALEGWAIDDISVIAQPNVEYSASSMTASPMIYNVVGDSVTFSVTVTNNGFNTAGTNVDFKVGSTVVGTVASGTIAMNATKVVTFKYPFTAAGIYSVSAVLANDENNANNTSNVVTGVEVYTAGWLAEGFEGTFLPSRWIKWGLPYWTQGTTNFYDGSKAAEVTLLAGSTGSRIVTPRLGIATGDSLIFWAKASVVGPQIQLRYNTLADTTATWSTFGSPINLTASYFRYAVDLSSLAGASNPRIAFEGLPNSVGGTINLDKVTGPIIYIPTSAPGPVVMVSPADRTINVNPKTVVLDWNTPLSGGDPELYAVYIGTVNDTTLVDSYVDYAEVYVPTSQYQPYPTFQMTYNTDYYWMVVPWNANGNPRLADCPIYKLTTQPEPISGNWTINPIGSGTTNFTSFTAAVNYLNLWGVGTGGVTFTVYDTTYVETIPAITASGTATDQIIFVSGGSRAKPVIMPGTGTGTNDSIIKLNGCDYVTFNGFDIKENPANTTGTTQMEFGIVVSNNGATNGAQYNTIKNCNITLAGTSVTRGVVQSVTSVTTAAGANSYNRYLDNDLLNCWYGYLLTGSTTAAAYDQNVEISAVADGSITNCLHGVNYSNQTGLLINKQDIVLLGAALPTAIEYGIYGGTGGSNTVTITENDISNASAVTTTNATYGINITSGASATIHTNNIHNLDRTGTSGTTYGINLTAGATGQVNNVYNNQIQNINNKNAINALYVTAAYTNNLYDNTITNLANTGTTGIIYSIYLSSGTNNVYGNEVSNVSNAGTSAIYGVYASSGTNSIHDNSFNTYSSASSGAIYGAYVNGGANNIYLNTFTGYTVATTGAIYGFYFNGGTLQNIYNNLVHNFTGGGIIWGYQDISAIANVFNTYNNKFYNFEYTGTSTSLVGGIRIGYSTDTGNYYNNMVYDLRAPNGTLAATAPQIVGMQVNAGGTNSIYNNTVYINATGSSANFSTAAFYNYAGTTNNIQNNIFVNKSTPGATGRTVASWKYAANFTNVAAASNKNIYYAGASSPTTLIFYDGTNTCQTLDAYKALIATKDQMCYSENVPFLNPASPYDVHIAATPATAVEGLANVINPPVSSDIDGEARHATAPDIGADEGTFTAMPAVIAPTQQPSTLVLVPASTSIGGSFTACTAEGYLVVRHTTATLGAIPIDMKNYALADTVGTGAGVVVGKGGLTTFTTSSLTASTMYYFTIFSYNEIGVNGPKYYTVGPLTGNKQTLPTAPAEPVSLTATTYSYNRINLAATPNASSDNIMVAWSPTSTFGTPASDAAYSSGSLITGGGTVWYVGPAAGLPNHTSLAEATTYNYKAWSYVTSDVYKVYSTIGKTANATTAMQPVTPPYTQNFDAVTTPAMPAGWTVENVGSLAPYWQTSAYGSSTPNCLSIGWDSYNDLNDWAITPPLNLTGGVTYNVTFKYKAVYNSYYENLSVKWGDAAVSTSLTNQIFDAFDFNTDTYTNASCTLTPSYSGTFYVGWYGYSDADQDGIYVDDIKIYTGTWDDYAVSTLAVTPSYKFASEPITVNFRVTNNGDVTTGKKAYLKIGSTRVDSLEVGTLANGAYVDKSFTYTFTTGGTYDITVEMNTDQVASNNSVVLASQIVYASGQLAEGFEGTTFPPSRWLNWGSTTLNKWVKGTTSSSAYDGVQYASLTIGNVANNKAHLATPILDIQSGSTFKFWARSSVAGPQLQMKYSAGSDTTTATWTSLGSPITLTTTYTEYTVDISSLVARGHYRLAFNGLPNATTYSIYLDKVVGPQKYIPNEAPGTATLTAPVNGVTEVNPRTVVLDWDEPLSGGNPTSYNVYVSNNLSNMTGQFSFSVAAPVTQLTPYTYSTPTILTYGTKLYWLVQPTNSYGSTPIGSCTIDTLTTKKQMVVTPTALNLGAVFPGSIKTGTISVQNVGPNALTFTPTGSAQFGFGAAPSVPGDSTKTVSYTFTAPETVGDYTGSIIITMNTPGAEVVTIPVTGSISRTVQIGTGTSELNVPIEPWYRYSYSQSIYLASDLGISAPKQINKITYNYSGMYNLYHTNQWQVYMANVATSEFPSTGATWLPISSMTPVFSGTIVADSTGAANWSPVITLDTPFMYDNTKNLMIAVAELVLSTTYDNTGAYFLCQGTTAYRAIQYQSDSVIPDPAVPTMAATSKLGYPNIKMELGDIPTTPTFAVTPTSWDFGSIEQFIPSTAKTFTVTNGGSTSFNVTSVYVEGGNFGDFTVTASGLPATVGIFTGYQFSVVFTPSAAGTRTTTLKIVDNLSRTIHSVTLTGTGVAEVVGIPINLTATVSNYADVALSWGGVNTGLSTPPWLHWDNGTVSTSFKSTSGSSFDTAAKYAATDLAAYNGYTINRVKFYAANYDSSAYRVRVWTGSDTSLTPSFMVVDQIVTTYTQAAWNEIVLESPVTINSSDAIWVGYNVVYTPTSYPAAVDAGPKVATRGCLHNITGTWAEYTGNNNLNVQAYVQSPARGTTTHTQLLSIPVVNNVSLRNVKDSSPVAVAAPSQMETRALTGYNVYRDDVQVNGTLIPTGTTTYNDLSVSNGAHSYYVKAVYMSGNSPQSNTATVTINKPAPWSLPFTETWSSSSFDTQLWNKVASNWVISGSTGNAAPAVRFNYNPIASSYSYTLTSWDIDAVEYADVKVKYDVLLDTGTTETVERLAVEVYSGATWHEIDSFTNQSGDFSWNSKSISVSSLVGNSEFKLRFRAYGSDSSTLNYWAIDNIVVEAIIAPPAPVVTPVLTIDNDVELSWPAVTGASSYKIYKSTEFLAEFPSAWTLAGSTTTPIFTYTVGDDTFMYFRVTTVVGGRVIAIEPSVTPLKVKPIIRNKN